MRLRCDIPGTQHTGCDQKIVPRHTPCARGRVRSNAARRILMPTVIVAQITNGHPIHARRAAGPAGSVCVWPIVLAMSHNTRQKHTTPHSDAWFRAAGAWRRSLFRFHLVL